MPKTWEICLWEEGSMPFKQCYIFEAEAWTMCLTKAIRQYARETGARQGTEEYAKREDWAAKAVGDGRYHVREIVRADGKGGAR